jgi:hypothetical protein
MVYRTPHSCGAGTQKLPGFAAVALDGNNIAARWKAVHLELVCCAQEGLKLRDNSCRQGVEGNQVAGGVGWGPPARFNEVPSRHVTKVCVDGTVPDRTRDRNAILQRRTRCIWKERAVDETRWQR